MKLKAWKTAVALALKKTPRTAPEFAKLPEHVAIIMDGNGRWAKKHHLNVSRGHRQGTETLREIIHELDAKNVRIRILGDKGRLPEKQRETLKEAEKRTESNTGLQLNIAINYGSRAEMVKAVREISVLVKNGTIRAEEISEQMISDHLYTAGQPDVDLLIRTSGEKRLSNFLLYQNAYAEFVFPDTLWPDFSVHDYDLALDAYGHRDRRYGGR